MLKSYANFLLTLSRPVSTGSQHKNLLRFRTAIFSGRVAVVVADTLFEAWGVAFWPCGPDADGGSRGDPFDADAGIAQRIVAALAFI